MHILEIIGKSYEKALTSCCSYDIILTTLPVSAFRKKKKKSGKKYLTFPGEHDIIIIALLRRLKAHLPVIKAL